MTTTVPLVQVEIDGRPTGDFRAYKAGSVEGALWRAAWQHPELWETVACTYDGERLEVDRKELKP